MALTVVTALLLSALLSLHLLPDKVSLRAGQVSAEEVKAARTVQYEDREATRQLADDSAARVDPIYVPVPYVSAFSAAGRSFRHSRTAPRAPGNVFASSSIRAP